MGMYGDSSGAPGTEAKSEHAKVLVQKPLAQRTNKWMLHVFLTLLFIFTYNDAKLFLT